MLWSWYLFFLDLSPTSRPRQGNLWWRLLFPPIGSWIILWIAPLFRISGDVSSGSHHDILSVGTGYAHRDSHRWKQVFIGELKLTMCQDVSDENYSWQEKNQAKFWALSKCISLEALLMKTLHIMIRLLVKIIGLVNYISNQLFVFHYPHNLTSTLLTLFVLILSGIFVSVLISFDIVITNISVIILIDTTLKIISKTVLYQEKQLYI